MGQVLLLVVQHQEDPCERLCGRHVCLAHRFADLVSQASLLSSRGIVQI